VATLAGIAPAGVRADEATPASQKLPQRPEAVLNSLVKRYSAQEIFWLDIDEEHRFRLKSGAERVIRLISIKEHRDSVVHLMRRAEIGVKIDGRPLELICEPYTMPTQTAGLRLLADTTTGWNEDMLPKQVQFSAWDAADPIVDVKRFGFPIRNYRLFSHSTQAYNEAVHLGRGDDDPTGQKFYHNYGVDMAGFERREEVVSATDGEIVRFFPSREHVSAINVQDGQGHRWNYEHLDSTFPEIVVGARVARGQRLGMMGKTGPSGNFSHLHLGWLGPMSRHLNLYPWLVAAYQAEHPKPLYAIARPHHTVVTGETVRFDGSKSLAFHTKIVSWRWVFHDGQTVNGTRAEKVFDHPGAYIASLWVKDETGAEDVDFCQVKVFSKASPESGIPTIFMTYTPTEEICVNQPVLFRIWFQGRDPGRLVVDFGDATRLDDYASYSEVTHRFQTAGIHVVTAQCEVHGKSIMHKQKVVVATRSPRRSDAKRGETPVDAEMKRRLDKQVYP
jgi:murein DD-endopeptidase MepM/ murein hydrolase activator NlpD